ncbi:MAG: magnesium transporter CorA family protein [Acidimicrobiia bacterium]|nr:magnesium transporter CorA family protein [Acidimicrobiia bacterium]
MQRLFHIAEGADRAVDVDPADLGRLRAAGGWIWLDVVGIDASEMQAIADEFGFDHLAVEDVLDESEYPKVDDYPDHTLAVLLGIADDEEKLRIVEYDVFLGAGYLVTVLHEDLPGVGWMREHLIEPGRLAGLGPDRFCALLVEAEAGRFRTLVDSLEGQIEGLEDRALAADATVIGEIYALRRDALMLRRVVGPLEDAIHRLAGEPLPAIGQRAGMRFASIEDGYERIIETLDAARGLLAAVLETYRASAAEKANEVMKVLTVFAAIVLPLSLMAGLYGMNFEYMPELGWRWSYFALLGAMATVGIGLWLYFSWRGFISGPRFSAVPRTIGRGLSGVVRLTTKPVAGLARVVRGRADPVGDPPDDPAT